MGMEFVYAILIVFLILLVTLPFTHKWVSKRNRYLAKLNSIGFEESNDGLIRKKSGDGNSTEVFFPTDYPESSSNPGASYTVAHSQGGILLVNSIISIYYFAVYKRRIRSQRRAYNREQIKLIEQLEKSDGDVAHLKDAFSKEFSADATTKN